MKLIYFKKKIVCILLVIIFTLQSCTVYKKTPVTLEEAKNANLKTLVIDINNTKHKYKRITLIDGQYYGEIKKNQKYPKDLLSETEIKSIQTIDKTATTVKYSYILLTTIGLAILIKSLNDALEINLEE